MAAPQEHTCGQSTKQLCVCSRQWRTLCNIKFNCRAAPLQPSASTLVRERMDYHAGSEWFECRLKASSMAEYRSSEYYSILESLQLQECCGAEEHLLRSYLSSGSGLDRLHAFIQVEGRRKALRHALSCNGMDESEWEDLKDQRVKRYILAGVGDPWEIAIRLVIGLGRMGAAAGQLPQSDCLSRPGHACGAVAHMIQTALTCRIEDQL